MGPAAKAGAGRDSGVRQLQVLLFFIAVCAAAPQASCVSAPESSKAPAGKVFQTGPVPWNLLPSGRVLVLTADGLVAEALGISEVGCRVKAAAGPQMMPRSWLWPLPYTEPQCISVHCLCQLSLCASHTVEGEQLDIPCNAV